MANSDGKKVPAVIREIQQGMAEKDSPRKTPSTSDIEVAPHMRDYAGGKGVASAEAEHKRHDSALGEGSGNPKVVDHTRPLKGY
jgi:hypothetical protein